MIALLLVPLAASGHAHRDGSSSRSCATCIAAHHSPAAVSVALPLASATCDTFASPLPVSGVPPQPHRSPRAGRAPPLPTPLAAV